MRNHGCVQATLTSSLGIKRPPPKEDPHPAPQLLRCLMDACAYTTGSVDKLTLHMNVAHFNQALDTVVRDECEQNDGVVAAGLSRAALDGACGTAAEIKVGGDDGGNQGLVVYVEDGAGANQTADGREVDHENEAAEGVICAAVYPNDASDHTAGSSASSGVAIADAKRIGDEKGCAMVRTDELTCAQRGEETLSLKRSAEPAEKENAPEVPGNAKRRPVSAGPSRKPGYRQQMYVLKS